MKKYILLIIGLIFSLAVNIYFRSFPINFPQLRAVARHNVESKLTEEAVKTIEQNFPEYSGVAKNKLVQALIKEKKKNQQEIKGKIDKEYQDLKKTYQDEHGQTYLMELDCWHWARYVENTVRLGHPGDKVIGGRQFDNLMLAPNGAFLPWNQFLFYLSAFLFKVFSLFKAVSLYTFLFYLPLFFIAIFIIVLYLFSYQHGGNLCAVISTLFTGLSITFLQRSCAGWFDTDILNLLFPLLIVWSYLFVHSAKIFKSRLFWINLASFFVGLFCFTWTNWWFIFLIIIAYEIYSLLNLIAIRWQYKEKTSVLFKQHLLALFLFILLSIFWIIILSGIEPIRVLTLQVKNALVLNEPFLKSSIWPNVFVDVSELQKLPLSIIIDFTGGFFLFVASIICLLVLFLRYRNEKLPLFKRESIVILMFWFFAMLFACFKGGRFIVFLIVPMGIFLGWAIKEADDYFKERRNTWGKVIVIGITVALCAIFINRANRKAKYLTPLIDNKFYKLLTDLKEKTSPEAIINSWWDLGDWFKVIAHRRVIFDGQSQEGSLAYWMARAILANNEEEAIRILRMLNNGGSKAYELINQHLKDAFKSVLFLKEIILAEEKNARESLIKALPLPVATEVAKLLFEKPVSKAYFLVDPAMVWKISPISYIANWDFFKAYILQNLNKKNKLQLLNDLIALGLNQKQAEQLKQEATLISTQDIDQWISPRFNFQSTFNEGKRQKDIVFFDNGLVFDIKGESLAAYTSGRKFDTPKSLFLLEDDKLKEVKYLESNANFSVLVAKPDDKYQAICLDPELAGSLFVRLYFFGGKGLKHFKPFMEEKDGVNYTRIFEIIWD